MITHAILARLADPCLLTVAAGLQEAYEVQNMLERLNREKRAARVSCASARAAGAARFSCSFLIFTNR